MSTALVLPDCFRMTVTPSIDAEPGVARISLAVWSGPKVRVRLNDFWKIIIPDVSLTAVSETVPETVLLVELTLKVAKTVTLILSKV